MLFASDYNDNRIHIDETHSNQEYYCPYCGAPLITKKGEQRRHHFAHKKDHICSDSWERSGSYDLSPWHNEWQKQCYWATKNCRDRNISIYDVLDKQMQYIEPEYRDRAARFRSIMSRVSRSNPYDAISILMELGYRSYLEKENLDAGKVEILQMIAKHETSIRSFLDRLQMPGSVMHQRTNATTGNPIVLSTIHSSKGQEYDSVYMVDVHNGRFPSYRSDLYCRSKDSADGGQEERRLFYVGITRAKNKLHLFDILGKPSSFLDDLFPERKKSTQQAGTPRYMGGVSRSEHSRTQYTIEAEAAQMNSVGKLPEEYRHLPVMNVRSVAEIQNENYDQEHYLIYDMIGFRRVKCTVVRVGRK